jgi:hypothetical protein
VRAYHMGVYILVREREQEYGLRYGFGSDKKGAVHTKMITRGQNHIRGHNHTHTSRETWRPVDVRAVRADDGGGHQHTRVLWRRGPTCCDE